MTYVRPIALATLTLVPEVALSFCGTYVGTPGSETTNTASRIAIARDGEDIVLTMANDYSGDLDDFGLLIPVPPTLSLDDVSVVAPAALNDLDLYTGPRLVTYTEAEIAGGVSPGSTRWVDGEATPGTTSSGCGAPSAPPTETQLSTTTDPSTGLGTASFDEVVLQEVSTVGGYQLSLISAEDANALSDWALDRGLDLTPETAEALDAAIAGGAWFVAAEVSLDAVERDVHWLPPLQLSYRSAVASLPIRLGATASSGVQDLLVFALNHALEGWTGISNYDEAPIQSECLFTGTDFSQFYTSRSQASLTPVVVDTADDTADTAAPTDITRATWLVEYGWGSGKCDPCTDSSGLGLQERTVRELGWVHGVNDIYVTRIRMRFRPQDIDQDLMLYSSYVPYNTQLRYIHYADFLTPYFPVCDDSWQSAVRDPHLDHLGPALPIGSAAGVFLLLLGLGRRRTAMR